jgi:hypothetical protein
MRTAGRSAAVSIMVHLRVVRGQQDSAGWTVTSMMHGLAAAVAPGSLSPRAQGSLMIAVHDDRFVVAETEKIESLDELRHVPRN